MRNFEDKNKFKEEYLELEKRLKKEPVQQTNPQPIIQPISKPNISTNIQDTQNYIIIPQFNKIISKYEQFLKLLANNFNNIISGTREVPSR